jgi:hypothetical protein
MPYSLWELKVVSPNNYFEVHLHYIISSRLVRFSLSIEYKNIVDPRCFHVNTLFYLFGWAKIHFSYSNFYISVSLVPQVSKLASSNLNF